MSVPEFHTPFLNHYMAMVEDTESPRLFHLWSAITGAAAALGRRCFFQLGPITVYPNHYTLLVGTPASRKRSEEHTSELQSLMRISYAVFCLKKKTIIIHPKHTITSKTNTTHYTQNINIQFPVYTSYL